MEIFDISVSLKSQLPVWPGEPNFNIKKLSEIKSGDQANVSHISLGVHTGTHVDAPVHFVDGGASLDELFLDHFIGEVEVIEIKGGNLITSDQLEKIEDLGKTPRILFKTSNSEYWVQKKEEFQLFHEQKC